MRGCHGSVVWEENARRSLALTNESESTTTVSPSTLIHIFCHASAPSLSRTLWQGTKAFRGTTLSVPGALALAPLLSSLGHLLSLVVTVRIKSQLYLPPTLSHRPFSSDLLSRSDHAAPVLSSQCLLRARTRHRGACWPRSPRAFPHYKLCGCDRCPADQHQYVHTLILHHHKAS